MTQHADNIWNEGKFLPLFTDHRRCWKCCPSIRKHSSHRQKTFWFTFLRCTAEIMKFPYECFLSVLLLFEGYSCKLCPSNNPRRKSLAPISSNFSSVSTWRLCFVFLSIKNPVVLSLFAKLWIVCLLGTLSPQNLCRNFRQHLPADPYFT
jgi:hypothetical protein